MKEAPRVERPVTIDVLRRVAQAGYVAEVHHSIQFSPVPISVSEGAELVATALRAEATKFETEANVLSGLGDLSDDPRWQEKFGKKADELRSKAHANWDEAQTRSEAAQEFRQLKNK